MKLIIHMYKWKQLSHCHHTLQGLCLVENITWQLIQFTETRSPLQIIQGQDSFISQVCDPCLADVPKKASSADAVTIWAFLHVLLEVVPGTLLSELSTRMSQVINGV